MEHFLNPTQCNFHHVAPQSEPVEYLNRNHNNILAEFWALVDNPSPTIFEITVGKTVHEEEASHTELAAIVRHKTGTDRFPGAAAAEEKEPSL